MLKLTSVSYFFTKSESVLTPHVSYFYPVAERSTITERG